MRFLVLPLLAALGYLGSLISRKLTIQSGRMLGALLFVVPLAGVIVALQRWDSFSSIVIWIHCAHRLSNRCGEWTLRPPATGALMG